MVDVRGMPSDEVCEHETFVNIAETVAGSPVGPIGGSDRDVSAVARFWFCPTFLSVQVTADVEWKSEVFLEVVVAASSEVDCSLRCQPRWRM